jgi:hypothetical protein
MPQQSTKDGKMGKKCKFCGTELIRKEKEGAHNFSIRKYCDVKCAMNGARKDKHWRNGDWPVPYRRDL